MPKFDLNYFITRSRVKIQYRAFIRASMRLRQRDIGMAADIRDRIHEGFRTKIEGDFNIRQMLANGARQLTLLESLCEDSRGSHTLESCDVSKTTSESMSVDRPTWPWER